MAHPPLTSSRGTPSAASDSPSGSGGTGSGKEPGWLSRSLNVFQYSTRAVQLVWETSKFLTIVMAVLTLIAGLLPASMAYVGKLIVDAVVHASQNPQASSWDALRYVGLEALIVAVMAAVSQGLAVVQALLRALLGQRVNVMILEKTLTLELAHFEDSEFYDKLTRARREASSRPLSLVRRTFGLAQNAISLITYGGLLLQFSGWAVGILVVAGLPAFIAETRFSGEAFRLFKWRVPETRQQAYYEMVIAREDFAKEIQLLGLGRMFLDRYIEIFRRLFGEDRALTLRRGLWAWGLGLLSTAAFYGAYAWIAGAAITRTITLGDMTMYLLVFKQAQSAFSSSLSSIGGMYEDNLYLSTLYEFLEAEVTPARGGSAVGPIPGDGVRFEGVSFTYPGADRPAVTDLHLHLEPGQKLALVGENGSGKTTVIKLLTRLYTPSSGRILLDGLDLQDWDMQALRRRIGVIFQDFVRYQMSVGENIGVGDLSGMEDETRWREAADKGMALPFIEPMPEQFKTQLGRWFFKGRELSLGQWQKVALSRAFMRTDADLLVLDEPTAAMDAEAEVRIFDHFKDVTRGQMAILISHRFSTVRMADRIAVLKDGQLSEYGTHESLMALNGRYAHLFSIQAAGYQ